MRKRHRRRERRKAIKMIAVGIGLMVAGAVGLLIPFIAITTAQDWALLDEPVQAVEPSRGRVLPGAVITAGPKPDVEQRDVTNRLFIPQVGVDMPLFAGDDSNVLLKGGWLFPGTALPGQQGNSVIFGHRFRYLPPVSNTFFHLDELKVGEEFTVQYEGQAYTYRVIGTSIIEPTDFSVLEQGDKKWITLITCAPAFSTKYRLVVIGELVE
jgi:sortase A